VILWLGYDGLFNGQKFLTIIGNFMQPTYKIGMCPLACENHMLF
jgi:hypothetical protein